MDEYTEIREYFSNIQDDEVWQGNLVRELALKFIDLAEFEKEMAEKRVQVYRTLLDAWNTKGQGRDSDG